MKSAQLRFLFRAALSFGLIAWLLSRLDWIAVGKLIRGVYLGPLLAGALLNVTAQFFMAERTRLMLGHWAVRLGHASAFSATWIGQFCNNFLPGGMGGDMVKFFRISRLHPHAKATTLVALVADRVLALVALLALSGVALIGGGHDLLRQLVAGAGLDSLRARLPAWWVACLGLLGAVALLGGLVWRFRRVALEKSAHHLQSLRAALSQGKRFDGRIVVAFVLAVLVHSLGIVAAFCFARALAIPASLVQMFLVWPVVIVAMMMPVSVNGYGLREFVLLYYFGRWHLSSQAGGGVGINETVVVFSLLVVVNDLVCNLPGGLLLLVSASSGDENAPARAPRHHGVDRGGSAPRVVVSPRDE